ncbi:nitrilase [Sinobacterium caligoides]|uniref:Nitrilase n=1 Tax=Sinobacterium caligoides TaxID=933926 RepID=A0A3N2DZW8_9GAMM|nr:carbon-nitrogen hydrolase family protein [Sinobacterium caligoides]ROS05411.1 nitrilase [Sinobacterium caligoides]
MKKKIIAALQLGSSAQGTADTLRKILSYKERIKDSNCDLLVMPEALLGGYPKGADFGTRVGYRTEQGREEFLQYWEQAVDIDGPEVLALVELAKDCNTSIVLGIIERGGSTLYCTALFITEQGEVAKHRKLMPTASERLIWGQGDGSTMPVIETSAGRIGAAICWENYMPLLRSAMYAKGLEIWCAPTVDDREIWQSSMKHIAYEGRNFLVSACQYQQPPGDASVKDVDWPKDKPLIRGGSVIVSPMGEVLAGPLYNSEGLLSAEIDLNDIIKARYDMDPTGHYSRPDVFKLIVNEQERPAVTIIESEACKDI